MLKRPLITCLLLITTLITGSRSRPIFFSFASDHTPKLAVAWKYSSVNGRQRAIHCLYRKLPTPSFGCKKLAGKFQSLDVRQATDRLRAFLPSRGTVSVVGECEYGVLQRDVAFLLQYYPKAIAGEPEKLNALQPRPSIPLEIMPRMDGKKITFTVLHEGKPLPKVKLITVDDDLVNEELTTDAAGTSNLDAGGRVSLLRLHQHHR